MAVVPHHPAATVSVVIPTFNRVDRLLRLLGHLRAQRDVDPFEVVVVDDGSTDATAARLAALGPDPAYRLVVVATPNRGPAAARNTGWHRAQGERIAFIDDDAVPDPGWLAGLTAALEGADLAAGRIRPPADQRRSIGPFSRFLDVAEPSGWLTCNVGYRRAALEAVGGFDEEHFPLHNGEDTDLGLRVLAAGHRGAWAPDALVLHDVHPSDFRAHLGDVRHLEGMVALVARHPSARREVLGVRWWLRSVDKAVLLCWAAGALVGARPRSRAAVPVLAGALAAYGWGFTRSHYRPRSRAEWLTSLPLAFVADSWALVVMVRASWRHRTVLL